MPTKPDRADRIACCVPFCRRTAAKDKFPGCTEIICGKHWRLVSRTWRRRYSALWRRHRRIHGDRDYWQYAAGSPQRLDAVQSTRLLNAMWERGKQQSIERAAGL